MTVGTGSASAAPGGVYGIDGGQGCLHMVTRMVSINGQLVPDLYPSSSGCHEPKRELDRWRINRVQGDSVLQLQNLALKGHFCLSWMVDRHGNAVTDIDPCKTGDDHQLWRVTSLGGQTALTSLAPGNWSVGTGYAPLYPPEKRMNTMNHIGESWRLTYLHD
ncbi:hypothetical protein K1T35_24370 [Pseudonocardia sp. DSM 110487]|uniref:hypothetical protein n=1 Tax=Pseudonocardia sp. DSM 110487 TaxID=2865833 RepID=UPI001C6A1B61|nr:hypothetical protein [Pseudonocardia sp. DSM 110487]QYN31789.1 hypothetical protein K1T35_24370 [Pseudonocardia sp. DSM 110487]